MVRNQGAPSRLVTSYPREVERPELGPCSDTYGMDYKAVQPLLDGNRMTPFLGCPGPKGVPASLCSVC